MPSTAKVFGKLAHVKQIKLAKTLAHKKRDWVNSRKFYAIDSVYWRLELQHSNLLLEHYRVLYSGGLLD